ncbi:hypothetical protein BJ138DRAFT_968443, partial [Hygrophoropsis aurantiaca]
ILKTAKRYNMTFAPTNLSKDLKMELPSWFHLGTPSKTFHKSRDECLKTNHPSEKISNLMQIANRLDQTQNHQSSHSRRKNCKCNDCKTDRNNGCLNPNKCATNALKIIDSINPKLNPTKNPRNDNLTLTHRRKEKNQQAIKTGIGEILFDPTLTTRSSLGDCFRIF